MDILFRQSASGREPALVTRDDGVRLSVPVYGKLEPLPHDLAHYVVERELDLPDGFWGNVAAGAIFPGMAVVDGCQPPHARERSQALMKANHRGILFSEGLVEAAVHAVKGDAPNAAPLPIDSPHVPSRTRADRDTLLACLLPAMRAMCTRWWAVPEGEGLLVVWPSQPVRRARRRAAQR